MKKILLAFILMLSSFNIFAQTDKLNQLFDQYQETDGVTSIKIAKPMFRLLGNLNIDDAELSKIKPLINKVNSLKILVVEKPSKGDKDSIIAYRNFQKVQTSMLSALKELNFEELMTVNSKDNKIKFLAANTASNILDNLLLTINGEDSNVLMMLDGKISMDDVSNLVNDVQEKTQKTLIDNNTTIRNTPAFRGIEVSSGIVIDFTQGNERKVEVNADADKIQFVKTEVQNGILKIYIDKNPLKNKNFKKLSVNIQNPKLEELEVSSGSIFNTKNTISENKINANINSGAIVNADFNIDNITINANSGSILNLGINSKNILLFGNSGIIANFKGKTDIVSFKLDSGASCNAQNLIAKNAKVDLDSGAIAKVNATSTLDVIANSGAIVQYKGNPEIISNIKKNSGAVIKKID